MKPIISEKTKYCDFNELLVKQAPFGLALIEASGRWLLINPAFTRITGYTAEDLPDGKTWFEKAFPDPEKRAEFLSSWLADRKKGEAVDRALEIRLRGRGYGYLYSLSCCPPLPSSITRLFLTPAGSEGMPFISFQAEVPGSPQRMV